MANKGKVQNNEKRKKMAKNQADKRARLKAIVADPNVSPEERMQAQLRLNEMPRNGSKVRVRNRCEVTGRPRGYYRKFKMSRIALREHASKGHIPGVTKASW